MLLNKNPNAHYAPSFSLFWRCILFQSGELCFSSQRWRRKRTSVILMEEEEERVSGNFENGLLGGTIQRPMIDRRPLSETLVLALATSVEAIMVGSPGWLILRRDLLRPALIASLPLSSASASLRLPPQTHRQWSQVRVWALFFLFSGHFPFFIS